MSGAAFIEAGSQRYSPIQENAATKPASRPTSRASDGKIQDGYAEPSTPISKADTKPSPLSQSQHLSIHTTTETSSYSLQFFLDMGFSLADATRIYHARVRRLSERDKQPANDREISLSFQDLPSVSGLSSPSKQQQPTTPLHVRVSAWVLLIGWALNSIIYFFSLLSSFQCEPRGRCYLTRPSWRRKTVPIPLNAATQRRTTASWDRFPSPAR